MPLTVNEQRLQPLGLTNIPVSSDAAYRVDLKEKDKELLTLKALDALVDAAASIAAGGATAGASIVHSGAAEASKVIKASAGTLISLVGQNDGATQYIQIHNAAALPADGAVPVYSFKVDGGTPFSLDVPITGIPFTTGIVVCNSSTLATKTIGAANCFFTAVIR